MTGTKNLLKALAEWRELPEVCCASSSAFPGEGELEAHNLREAYDRFLLSEEGKVFSKEQFS